jgi:DNA-directed RNA polymerase subunit RPC12/RpoP
MLTCWKCGKEFEEPEDDIYCPHCGEIQVG